MASKGQISGMRGVFLAAAELARLGFVVSPTSRSARGVDLLATNMHGTRTFAIEVKSVTKTTFWLLGDKDREWVATNNVFVFVKLGKEKQPSRFFVLPSKTVRRLMVRGTRFTFISRRRIEHFEDKWTEAFGRADARRS